MDTPKQLILSCIEKENKSVKKREKRRNYICRKFRFRSYKACQTNPKPVSTMKKDRKRQTNARNTKPTSCYVVANTYLADGVSGGVVEAWMLVLNPFAAFNLGGVTTLIKTRLVCTYIWVSF